MLTSQIMSLAVTHSFWHPLLTFWYLFLVLLHNGNLFSNLFIRCYRIKAKIGTICVNFLLHYVSYNTAVTPWSSCAIIQYISCFSFLWRKMVRMKNFTFLNLVSLLGSVRNIIQARDIPVFHFGRILSQVTTKIWYVTENSFLVRLIPSHTT